MVSASRIAGDDFADVVDTLAREIAANGPVAVRLLKETLRSSAGGSIDAAIAREAQAQAETFRTEDAREGLSAMVERRPPVFRGS
jgi:2-(1,2-epoxy-1,2-dihydrophenyl)acetyl-CoA isomerase